MIHVNVLQFSESSAESMRKVYGKFCSRHNEAVNVYKELHARDKRFQAFIRVNVYNGTSEYFKSPLCVKRSYRCGPVCRKR